MPPERKISIHSSVVRKVNGVTELSMEDMLMNINLTQEVNLEIDKQGIGILDCPQIRILSREFLKVISTEELIILCLGQLWISRAINLLDVNLRKL